MTPREDKGGAVPCAPNILMGWGWDAQPLPTASSLKVSPNIRHLKTHHHPFYFGAGSTERFKEKRRREPPRPDGASSEPMENIRLELASVAHPNESLIIHYHAHKP